MIIDALYNWGEGKIVLYIKSRTWKNFSFLTHSQMVKKTKNLLISLAKFGDEEKKFIMLCSQNF